MFFHSSSLFTVLYCWNSLFNASCFLIYRIGFSRSDVKISLNFVIKEFDSAVSKIEPSRLLLLPIVRNNPQKDCQHF